MKISKLSLVLLGLLAAWAPARALNLPPGNITLTAQPPTDSYLDFALSGVPTGYDVGNNAYLAWCVQLRNENVPSAGSRIGVLMDVSSPTLPAPFLGMPWDKINYLLNHKQGTPLDVQYALWFFTDGLDPAFFPPEVTSAAVAMIDDPQANGTGFVPAPLDVTAAAVVWQDQSVQAVIIEVPPATDECADRFTAGGFIYRNGSKATFGVQGGFQNGKLWGGISYIDHGTGMHVKGRVCTSYTVTDVNCRRATYDVTIDGVPGTATVWICDNGEPGFKDTLEISLSNGYTAGANTTLGNGKKGGGNVKLHKPNCGGKKASR